MTAARIFRQNGNFKESPLLESVARLHTLFTSISLPYAVIGGMAVVRNGAVRTTMDVDILIRKNDWESVRKSCPEGFTVYPDHAVDLHNKVDIDLLFPGDDWEMVLPVPEPEAVREYDRELGAYYIDLLHLLELKTAVFIKKREEDGIEIAAKDLADIVALTENNRETITADFIENMDPAVRGEYRNIRAHILQ